MAIFHGKLLVITRGYIIFLYGVEVKEFGGKNQQMLILDAS